MCSFVGLYVALGTNNRPSNGAVCGMYVDIITALVCIIIGSLIISGTISCHAGVGGVLLGLGCIWLAISPLLGTGFCLCSSLVENRL